MDDEGTARVTAFLSALRYAERRFWMDQGDRVEQVMALVGRQLYAELLKGDPASGLWRMNFETGQLIMAPTRAPVYIGQLLGRPMQPWEYRIVVGLSETGVAEAQRG